MAHALCFGGFDDYLHVHTHTFFQARIVPEDGWEHGTADVQHGFINLVNITESIKNSELQRMQEIRLGLNPKHICERIILELAPECALQGLTKTCTCTGGICTGGMHLFAKNWQARIRKIFKDVPLVWSKDVRDGIVHKEMLPLLAELILVDSCVFPIYTSSFSEEWKHTMVMDENFRRGSDSMFFSTKNICALFYRDYPGTREKQAYRSLFHNIGVIEWHRLGSMLSLDFSSHFWQSSCHCICAGCVPL
jgi:hypothetical protein